MQNRFIREGGFLCQNRKSSNMNKNIYQDKYKEKYEKINEFKSLKIRNIYIENLIFEWRGYYGINIKLTLI